MMRVAFIAITCRLAYDMEIMRIGMSRAARR
jgi:hypothetical protein